MAKKFRTALLERMKQTDRTIADIARGAGVSYEQLKKVVQREDASTNFDDGVKVAHYFGLSVDEFLSDTTAQDRSEALRAWRQLSTQEREFLTGFARARGAPGREAG